MNPLGKRYRVAALAGFAAAMICGGALYHQINKPANDMGAADAAKVLSVQPDSGNDAEVKAAKKLASIPSGALPKVPVSHVKYEEPKLLWGPEEIFSRNQPKLLHLPKRVYREDMPNFITLGDGANVPFDTLVKTGTVHLSPRKIDPLPLEQVCDTKDATCVIYEVFLNRYVEARMRMADLRRVASAQEMGKGVNLAAARYIREAHVSPLLMLPRHFGIGTGLPSAFRGLPHIAQTVPLNAKQAALFVKNARLELADMREKAKRDIRLKDEGMEITLSGLIDIIRKRFPAPGAERKTSGVEKDAPFPR